MGANFANQNGVNNMGPFSSSNLPTGTVAPTIAVPATGLLVPAHSPSGSVTNESAVFNYSNTISSTQERLANVLLVHSGPQGIAAVNVAQPFAATWAQGNVFRFQ
jgi:hypothetical protein